MGNNAAHAGRADVLADVLAVYRGSDGEATKALYARLAELGPIGTVALNLFRAQKNSDRAKVYRGGNSRGSYRGQAYDRKQWAIDNLASIMLEHGAAYGWPWGWGEDPAQEFHRFVLYVDTPAGQVSFHTGARGRGPDYPGAWDGVRGVAAARVCRFVAEVLAVAAGVPAPETIIAAKAFFAEAGEALFHVERSA